MWLGVFVPIPSEAQIARLEIHTIQTKTFTDQELLTGSKVGKPVTIVGELRIPRAGQDRLPAVVLMHGSGGGSSREDGWARELNGLGVASFIVDHFTGRGIVSTANDQTQLGRLAMIVDAYRALALLAKHPRIDANRIVLMGFSRGGQAALYAAMNRLWTAHGPADVVGYAAYIAFYPDCTTTFVNDVDVADRPIRVFHGAADDYNPAAPCRSYVDRLRRAGKNASITEYREAYHIFDNPLTKPAKLPQAQTTRRCGLEEAPDGRILNSQTKQPFTYADPCVEYGPTVAYNAQAHAASLKAVAQFMTATMQPR